MKSVSQVAVIIISYQDDGSIANAINSIDEQTPLTIFILDNGSTDSSLNRLKKIKSKNNIHIIRSNKNLGFSLGVNFILHKIIKTKLSFKYMFLLNPDAYSSRNLISKLRDELINQSLEIISPKILYFDDTEWFSGGYIDLYKQKYFLRKNLNSYKKNQIPQFCGAAALIKIDSFINAGMFRDDLFLYADEAFLSMDYKQLGYKIGYAPHLKAYHEVSKISNRSNGLKDYYLNRNNLFFYNEFGLNKLLLFNDAIKNFLYHIKRGRIRNAFYVLIAILHFILGKRGQRLFK